MMKTLKEIRDALEIEYPTLTELTNGEVKQLSIATRKSMLDQWAANMYAVDLLYGCGDTFGERDAAPVNPDQHHILDAPVAFADFVGNPRYGTAHFVGGHDLTFVH